MFLCVWSVFIVHFKCLSFFFSSQVSEVTPLYTSWLVCPLTPPLAWPTCNPEPHLAQTGSQLCKMSVCSEFAEHVWKPGSCKNCFHPRSAHANTKGRKGFGDEEEDECTSASPYIKPTIAVKPTMMNLDTAELAAEFPMNSQQVFEKMFALPEYVHQLH